MSSRIEKLLGGCLLGEGPHWDIESQSLYFVDINNHSIHRYVPATKTHTSAALGNHNVSIIIPIKGKKNEFIITLDKKVARVNWDGENSQVSNTEVLFEVDKGSTNVFNDGKCDSTGRLWAGTMGLPAVVVSKIPDKKGTLYSFQKPMEMKSHRKEVGISNGIAFDYGRKKMYYADSLRKTVDQYDFDIDTGIIGNLKHVFRLDNHVGLSEAICDGMTIDADGNLWIALFFASKVIKIDPRRPETLLETIEFPAKYITSVAFGGPNLDELYVTSARFEPWEESDGSLFRVTGLNIKGVPADEAVL